MMKLLMCLLYYSTLKCLGPPQYSIIYICPNLSKQGLDRCLFRLSFENVPFKYSKGILNQKYIQLHQFRSVCHFEPCF